MSDRARFWVGAYGPDMDGKADGIGMLDRDPDGHTRFLGTAVRTPSPTTLLLAGDVVYGVEEGQGRITAFAVDGDSLRSLGAVDAAGGEPCALAVLPGLGLLTASYTNGAVGLHPLADDGSLEPLAQALHGSGSGPLPDQEGPHAHDVRPWGDVVLTADLGSDTVHLLRVVDGRLESAGARSLPAGFGPRDLRPHPSGVVLALGELSGEIAVIARDGDDLTLVDRVAVAGFQPGDHAAAIALSQDGRFAYTGLRGSNRLAVTSISADGRAVHPVGFVSCGGDWPRHVLVESGWIHVCNQQSGTVDTFRAGDDGLPVPVGSTAVPSPTWLAAR